MANTKASARITQEEQTLIKQAIAQAEKQTSGEIRVHIENKCREAVLDRAAFLFAELKMHKTDLRNGVLFYVALDDKKFAVLGDAGINNVVSENFWEEVKQTVVANFAEQKFVVGLQAGISLAGEQLKAYFPYQSDDKNELSDEISFS